jgi:hypothetical protein
MMRWIALFILVPFSAYSVWITIEHGYFGFLDLATDGGWGLQVLLDLVISLFLVSTMIVRDARERKVVAWPWLLLTVALGSIGPLAYLAFRPSKSAARAANPA